MRTKIEIDYYWNCDQGIDIPEAHYEALKEDAEERIFEMMKQGNVSGELCTSVRFGKDKVIEEDENNGLTYSGWFDISNIQK